MEGPTVRMSGVLQPATAPLMSRLGSDVPFGQRGQILLLEPRLARREKGSTTSTCRKRIKGPSYVIPGLALLRGLSSWEISDLEIHQVRDQVARRVFSVSQVVPSFEKAHG